VSATTVEHAFDWLVEPSETAEATSFAPVRPALEELVQGHELLQEVDVRRES